MDNFYKSLDPSTNIETYNFDDPDSMDFDSFVKFVSLAKIEKSVTMPLYCFKTHNTIGSSVIGLEGVDVIIVEGLMSLYCDDAIKLYDLKIFIDV